MRLLIQKVKQASVSVEDQTISSISHGFLLFLGIHATDTTEKIDWMVNKVKDLRVFPDESGKMNLSILDVKGSALVISQFTLYGNCTKGRRPDFLEAAAPEIAKPLYLQFCKQLSTHLPLSTGEFGAHMDISLINDGPVTLYLER